MPIYIIFENNGEILARGDQNVGDTFVPYTFSSLPHRDGYRLDEEHLWDPDIPEIVPYVKSQVQIYHLNWIKLLNVFFVNDGKVIKQLSVDENSALEGNPGVPQLTKPGYKLVWTLDDAEYDMSAPVVEDNITLVATFVEDETPDEFTVTFDPDNGSAATEVKVEAGATVEKPEDPTKVGGVFAGWFNGDEEFDFNTPVNEDLTLKAVYVPFATVKSTNMDVQGKIKLNIKVEIPEELIDGAYGEIEYMGITTTADPEATGTANVYTFSVEIPAPEVRKPVSLKLFDADGNTIALFAGKNRLDNDTAVTNLYDVLKTVENNANYFRSDFVELARSMRSYCEYAREKFSVDPSIAYDYEATTISDDTIKENYSVKVAKSSVWPKGITPYGLSLAMESDTTMKVKFQLASGKTLSDYNFTINGRPATVTVEDNQVVISVPNIPAAELAQSYTIAVNGVTMLSNVSALSFAANCVANKSSSPETLNVARAICEYYNAAAAYFG